MLPTAQSAHALDELDADEDEDEEDEKDKGSSDSEGEGDSDNMEGEWVAVGDDMDSEVRLLGVVVPVIGW